MPAKTGRPRTLQYSAGDMYGAWRIVAELVYDARGNARIQVLCTKCNKVYTRLAEQLRRGMNRGCVSCYKLAHVVDGKMTCTKCFTTKPVTGFRFRSGRRRPKRRQSWCIVCDNELHRRARDRNRLAVRCTARRYADKKKYGYPDIFTELMESQGGCCAICKRVYNGELPRFAVDHCHKDMLIRGVLCHRCNHVLGYVGDEIRLLESAIQYLKSNAAIPMPPTARLYGKRD